MTHQPRHVTHRSAALRWVQPFAVGEVAACVGGDVADDASAGDFDVFRLGSLLALGDVELDLLPFLEAAVAAAGDRAEVHEHVRAPLDRDEAVALVAVEPLHSALRHLDLLGCACGAPPWPGAALATCLWPACHGTRGGRKRCGRLTARRLELSPFGQRGCRAPSPAPGTPGPVPAKPAWRHSSPGLAHPDRIRTSSPPDPARSMTRIQQPGSGTQGTSNRLGNPGGRSSVCGGCGQSPGRYLDVLAPGGVRAA